MDPRRVSESSNALHGVSVVPGNHIIAEYGMKMQATHLCSPKVQGLLANCLCNITETCPCCIDFRKEKAKQKR